MDEKKRVKPWSELSGSEKKAVLVGWAAIAAVLAWFFLPAGKGSAEAPAPSTAATEEPSPSVYQAASAETLEVAAQLMIELDASMQDGLPILRSGDPHAMGAHSQRFDAMVESAYTRFGSTIFEPLGRCGVASNYARTWWKAQTSAAIKGGAESAPGAIKDALEQFQANRTACLEAAAPLTAVTVEAKL